MATKKPAAEPDAPAAIYYDKTYSQRSLFMASGRELKVQRARLQVVAGDDEARQFLEARDDFELMTQAV